jgi:hypothetical protein
MSQFPPKSKRKKQAAGSCRRRGKSIAPWLVAGGGVLLVAVLLVVVLNSGGANSPPSDAPDGEPIAADSAETKHQWPPPAGVNPVGDHFGEPVAEVSRESFWGPLQRRSIDPLFRLSNLRMEKDPHFDQMILKMDVERLDELPASPGKIHLYARTNRTGYPILLFSNDLQTFLQSAEKSTTIGSGMPTGYRPDDSKFAFTVYMTMTDDRYVRILSLYRPGGSSGSGGGRSASFQVSNPLSHGADAPQVLQRKWLDEEREMLLGPGNSEDPLHLTYVEWPDGRVGVSTSPLTEDQPKPTSSHDIDPEEMEFRFLKKPDACE